MSERRAVERLSGKRFAPVGSRGARAARAAGLASGVGLLMAGGLLAFVALRPLGDASAVDAVAVPAVPEVRPLGAGLPEGGAWVAEVESLHAFSTIRRPLRQRPEVEVVEGAGDEGGGEGVVAEVVVPEPDASATRVREGRVVIEVADAEEAQPDVKRSLESIKLFGLFGVGEARSGAVVGFVHATRPDDPRFVEEGSAFEVPAAGGRGNADAARGLTWSLTAVDRERRRVLLSHGGETYALALFGEADLSPMEMPGEGEGAAGESVSAEGGPSERVADDGTVVVERSRTDIARRLREAGEEDASIEELFRLMDLGGEARGGEAEAEDDADGNADGAARGAGEGG